MHKQRSDNVVMCLASKPNSLMEARNVPQLASHLELPCTYIHSLLATGLMGDAV